MQNKKTDTEKNFFEKERGSLIVISGPSCAGKGTVCRLVTEGDNDLKVSVSETTRQPRYYEKDGREYIFVSKDDFKKRIEENAYLEYACVYEHYYGTRKEYVEHLLNKGYDVILEIDIQGAAKVRKNYKKGIFIFIAPPTMEELKKRIIMRGTENEKQMETRLKCAYDEMTNADDYSYIVINDDMHVAASQVRSIITAEKCRTERLKNKVKEILVR